MARFIVLLLALATPVVVPAAAGHGKGLADETIRVSASPPDYRGGSPGGVFILGTAAADAPSVEIDPASGRFVVHDPAGAVPYTTDGPAACTSLSPTRVSCPLYGPRVFLRLLGGADSLSVGAGVTGTIAGTTNAGADRINIARDYPGSLNLRGGGGGDVFAGGGAKDHLFGQDGRDRLRGRAGDDKLDGEAGADRANGGPGDDRLKMKANDRDKRIACGSGDDLAIIDRNLDPEPHNCERVRAR